MKNFYVILEINILQLTIRLVLFFYKNIIKKENLIKIFNDPIYYMKSLKNKTELKNTKKIHEYDGAALTKFYFGLRKIIKKYN